MPKLLVLGAGFSKVAGFPLGTDLWQQVLEGIKQTVLYENKVRQDLESFLEYKRAFGATELDEYEIDFEEFVSFLDLEHYLKLRGSDTWASSGNETQIIIRNFIARILYDCMSSCTQQQLAPCTSFVKRLRPNDYVVTFNYDTLVETCLERARIPYRLVPHRYVKIHPGHSEVDTSRSEVIVLKVHGSIDWFDIQQFEEACQYFRDLGMSSLPRDFIFRNTDFFRPRRIVDGPSPPSSLLNRIYRIENLGHYLKKANLVTEAPLILSPSYSKLLYADPLRELWYGFNVAGLFMHMVGIIGFSMPEHDEYVRQILFRLIRNFQTYQPDLPGFAKTKLKMVDYRLTPRGRAEYRDTYRFVDWDRTDCFFEGFGDKAIELIFDTD